VVVEQGLDAGAEGVGVVGEVVEQGQHLIQLGDGLAPHHAARGLLRGLK